LYLLSVWNGEFHPYRIVGDGLEPLAWGLPKVHARCMALSPDGTTIALGDFAGEVLLLNTATGAVVSRLSPPADPDKGGEPTALAFSPDGRQLAIGSMSGIVRLVALDGHGLPSPDLPAVRLGAHRGEVFSLAYSPDGHRLATSGADKGLSVWNFPILRAELARRNLDW
jgi:WD40 repeat protein